jgi:hypothetical protein
VLDILKKLRTASKACSFTGETQVLMADGTTKPISQVRVGDEVLATDPETGEQVAKTVTHVWVHQDTVLDLEVKGEIITATEDHRFWNATDQEFQRADQLGRDDNVLTADWRPLSVTRLDGSTARDVTAYNLTIQDIHTYHVGSNALLVHNDCEKPTNGNFETPEVVVDRHGRLTNGRYTVDNAGMEPHKTGSFAQGKSQFLSGVDAERAVLDAAAVASSRGLWVNNKAKVYVQNGPVGALGSSGTLTSWINVYRNKNGFVHGAPGSGP